MRTVTPLSITLQARTDHRLDISVPLDSWMTPVIRQALLADSYERTERDMVEAGVRPWDVVVELGTGLGVISAMCARMCGNEAVTTFEANPKMIPVIKETYRLNGVNPCLHNAILGPKEDGGRSSSETAVVPVYLHSDFWRSSTVKDPSWLLSDWVGTEMVPVVESSSVFYYRDVSMLICDIEGGEAELFKTLDLPSSLKKIVIETHPRVIGEKAVDRLLADFYALGFSLISTGGDVWFLARA